MRKFLLISFLVLLCAAWSCIVQKKNRSSLYELQDYVTNIPGNDSSSMLVAPVMEEGDVEAGYKYLIEGNAFSSGIPMDIYRLGKSIANSRVVRLVGLNKNAVNDFVTFKNDDRLVATFGCLQCHAQYFNNELIIGLGNSYSSFQVNTAPDLKLIEGAIKLKDGKNSEEWKTAERALMAGHLLKTAIRTEMQGPTPAQKIAEVMASHRDPVTLRFRRDTNYFPTPPVVIPEDVPALWITKKRKALTVNAMRQGNFLKHIVSTSITTLKDTLEAREIYTHTRDVWAYIKNLQAPKYPYPVDQNLAEKGKQIFLQTCSGCHGTYGKNGDYPNELIPAIIIGTDSLMWKYFIKYPEYSEWFNKSWFAVSGSPASTNPQPGYVPPPLDGVWITAPYLHNGSVPTIEDVLNSKNRPIYWKRNFNKQEYDYEKLGWRYETLSKPGGKKTYNTDIPGYGNYGHRFGDQLTDAERKAVIEYLKTL
ncbi:MAG: cytochrome c [Bacteroidota bacterium]